MTVGRKRCALVKSFGFADVTIDTTLRRIKDETPTFLNVDSALTVVPMLICKRDLPARVSFRILRNNIRVRVSCVARQITGARNFTNDFLFRRAVLVRCGADDDGHNRGDIIVQNGEIRRTRRVFCTQCVIAVTNACTTNHMNPGRLLGVNSSQRTRTEYVRFCVKSIFKTVFIIVTGTPRVMFSP